ncbi:MAG: hypothetical protein M3N51_05535 [Actinomycetota bacterium]|nr:hypothetical protein [Actinomycetota bacterium]
MPALCIWTPEDGLLAAVAPLGLAAAAGTALVVDLDPHGPRYPGAGSLADLVGEGPRRSDLAPSRAGLAVLRNGGIALQEALEVVTALMEGWPQVVLRLPCRPAPDQPAVPLVQVHPLLPGALYPKVDDAAVYQQAGFRVPPPGPGPVLPVPKASTVAALLSGVLGRRERWVRAWADVWRWPWR